jgi:hypothetical protein
MYTPNLSVIGDKSTTTRIKITEFILSKKYPPTHTIKGNKTTD